MTKAEKIQELLTRGVEEVIDRQHLLKRLNSGEKLRVKLGIDPTSPNIHIGRAGALWKLRAFQDLGHTVIFIVGDFTALIGDTSDKDAERPMMTKEQVKKNIKTYFEQASRIIDPKKAEMHYNSAWLSRLGFEEIGAMTNLFGLHEFEARENIAKRLKAGKRISLRELLYPIMQGYDSVAVKADVEIGGTDQRFNLLAGRIIQKQHGQEPQDILTRTLLEGTDGRKMSSSWGNVINVVDTADDIFGKVMSIPDELIERYFVLATNLDMKHIQEFMKLPNPRDRKERLAYQITTQYHGEKAAERARQRFIELFRNKGIPDDIETRKLKSGSYAVADLLVLLDMVQSKSEARRLIEQRGIKIDDAIFAGGSVAVDSAPHIIQVGKRKFMRVVGSGT